MEYFSLLKMAKEPFSNSPDPDFFFNSPQHIDCLQRLELAIRLRQGLNVVMGDVGLGKSTLCRQLIRRLSGNPDIVRVHLILDPGFTDENEFVITLAGTLGLGPFPPSRTVREVKAAIKDFLLKENQEKKLITALFIDEGQKMQGFCLEVLREFLNFETNNTKLLQIVIFAQEEFRGLLQLHNNFADRIANLFRINASNFFETQALIRFRLEKAGMPPAVAENFFSPCAILLLYLATGGAPRKIIMVCSKALLAIIISRGSMVNGPIMLAAIRQHASIQSIYHILMLNSRRLAPILILFIIIGSYWWGYIPGRFSVTHAPVSEKAVYEEKIRKAIESGEIKPAAKQPDGGEKADAQEKDTEPDLLPSPLQPERALPPSGQSPSSSAILGSINMRRGESLSKMIARVYGRFTPERLQQVLAVNPSLNKRGTFSIDTPVVFPWPDESEDFSGFSVLIGEWTDLNEAYSQMILLQKFGHPLKLRPVLAEDSKLTYRILLEKTFLKREEAETARGRLNGAMREQATIIEGKP